MLTSFDSDLTLKCYILQYNIITIYSNALPQILSYCNCTYFHRWYKWQWVVIDKKCAVFYHLANNVSLVIRQFLQLEPLQEFHPYITNNIYLSCCTSLHVQIIAFCCVIQASKHLQCTVVTLRFR